MPERIKAPEELTIEAEVSYSTIEKWMVHVRIYVKVMNSLDRDVFMVLDEETGRISFESSER